MYMYGMNNCVLCLTRIIFDMNASLDKRIHNYDLLFSLFLLGLVHACNVFVCTFRFFEASWALVILWHLSFWLIARRGNVDQTILKDYQRRSQIGPGSQSHIAIVV